MNVQLDIYYNIIEYIGKNKYVYSFVNKNFVNVYKKLYGTNTSIRILNKDNIELIENNFKSIKNLKNKKQKQLSLLVTDSNNVKLIKLYSDIGCLFHNNTLKKFAYNNNLECLEYIYDNKEFTYQQKSINICASAALNGSIDCLKFLYSKKCPWNEKSTFNAKKMKHYDCLKFLIENKCPIGTETIENAVSKNDLDFLQFLYKNGYNFKDCFNGVAICGVAIKNNNIECLKYLHESGCKLNNIYCKSLCNISLEYKNLECLRYCYNNGAIWTVSPYIYTEEIYLEFIKYTLKNNKIFETKISEDLATKGYLNCLKYLIENTECDFNKNQKFDITNICENAGKNGHIDLLKYTIDTGLYHLENKEDGKICEAVANSGQLESLKILYENGFKINDNTILSTIFFDQLNCLKYIYEVRKNDFEWTNLDYFLNKLQFINNKNNLNIWTNGISISKKVFVGNSCVDFVNQLK